MGPAGVSARGIVVPGHAEALSLSLHVQSNLMTATPTPPHGPGTAGFLPLPRAAFRVVRQTCVLTEGYKADDRDKDKFEMMMEAFVGDAKSKVADLQQQIEDMKQVGPSPCPALPTATLCVVSP